MRLHEIIPPHEPAELTYDLLHDTSNGVITNFIIDLYSSVVKDTSRFQLTAYEQYNKATFQIFLTNCITLVRT